MWRNDATLVDIASACENIIEFVEGMNAFSFFDDRKTQSAVIYQLLIMGEAVKRLSHDFRQQQPQIPWRKIAGTRDTLIHDYDDIDLDEAWRIATEDVPQLLQQLRPLLPPPHSPLRT
jgi:uncharacterized protein with HEPN domain